jgi:integrase/recombinase XerD
MSPLQSLLDEYLALRRALGHKLRSQGQELQQFVAFAGETGADHITLDLAMGWVMRQPQGNAGEWRRRRLGIIRQFAGYCSGRDPRTVIPPPDLLPGRYQRPTPYICSDADVARLLKAAEGLPSITGLRPRTYTTILGLYAVAGLRCSEAVQLDRDDVDLGGRVLTIRGTKFDKSRLVPIHSTTADVLRDYADCRDRLCRTPRSPSFFLSERGNRLNHSTVRKTFVSLSRQIGLRRPGDPHGPRLHDLRHRMAVNTLLRWYQDGVDVERHLPELSTYLGHVRVSDTYRYLTATPELLHQAMVRVEQADLGASI